MELQKKMSNSVTIFHFPFPQKDQCQNCNAKENLGSYAQKTIDQIFPNWTHIHGIILCRYCFSLTLKNSIPLGEIFIFGEI